MNPDAFRLFNLLFDEGETVCVSPDQYGYESVKQDDLISKMVELTSNVKKTVKNIPTKDLRLVAINPIFGIRDDSNCTAYRNFLVEIDDGSLASQKEYADGLGLPYSAAVFSGNKSIHFAISLTESLPSIEIYRFYANWILKVVDKADQNTKNPSRSIRIAGAIREGKEQKIIQVGERISLERLQSWLSKYEKLRPKLARESVWVPNEQVDIYSISPKYRKQFESGRIDFSEGRNNTWFKIGIEFGLKGFPKETMVYYLRYHFKEDPDFNTKEWEVAIDSGWRKGFGVRQEAKK